MNINDPTGDEMKLPSFGETLERDNPRARVRIGVGSSAAGFAEF